MTRIILFAKITEFTYYTKLMLTYVTGYTCLQTTNLLCDGGGRVVRWSWVNFQCRGVLQFG